MNSHLYSKNLEYKSLKDDDANLIFKLLSSSKHTRYISLPTLNEKEEAQHILGQMLSDKSNPTWTLWKDGTFAGLCGYRSSTVRNFIYSIEDSMQNLGLGYEAANTVLSQTSQLFGNCTIELNIHSENIPSLRIASKLGFEKVSSYRHQFPQDRSARDIYVFHKKF